MKLYTFPLSTNCRRAVAVARHLDLPLDYQIVDLTKGEHKMPAYLAINIAPISGSRSWPLSRVRPSGSSSILNRVSGSPLAAVS